MSLLRALGRGKKRKLEVLRLLEYAGIGAGIAKHTWKEKVIPWAELVATYGLPVDPIHAAGEIIGLHEAFGTPSSENLAYHVLIDFDSGLGLTPWDAGKIAWDINGYLRNKGIAFYQGVHTATQREAEHPHVHAVVNALYPATGHRLRLNHNFLIFYKDYANMVLRKAGVPMIRLGKRSLPFRIVIGGNE